MAIFYNSAQSIRENRVRLEFSEAVYISNLGDPKDGANPALWTINAVAGTVGIDGYPVHPVFVVAVEYSPQVELLDPADYKRYVDVILDRPMSAFPCQYYVAVSNVYALNKIDSITYSASSQPFFGLHKSIEPQVVDQDIGGRDFAYVKKDVDPNAPYDPFAIQSFGYDAGDYAFDEGLIGFKKRILRRLVTPKGAYAHMPSYGIGVPTYAKKLALAAVMQRVQAEAQSQIAEEPEVAEVGVTFSQVTPGLVKMNIRIKTKNGKNLAISAPFPTN